MAPRDFWASTAYEVMSWVGEHARGTARRITEAAWLAGYYGRVDKMPSLGDELNKLRGDKVTRIEADAAAKKALDHYRALGLEIPPGVVIDLG